MKCWRSRSRVHPAALWIDGQPAAVSKVHAVVQVTVQHTDLVRFGQQRSLGTACEYAAVDRSGVFQVAEPVR